MNYLCKHTQGINPQNLHIGRAWVLARMVWPSSLKGRCDKVKALRKDFCFQVNKKIQEWKNKLVCQIRLCSRIIKLIFFSKSGLKPCDKPVFAKLVSKFNRCAGPQWQNSWFFVSYIRAKTQKGLMVLKLNCSKFCMNWRGFWLGKWLFVMWQWKK